MSDIEAIAKEINDKTPAERSSVRGGSPSWKR